MQSAFDRCYRAVPVTLSNVRPVNGRIALKCFKHACPACRSFDADGRKAFEEELNVSHILPWSCDDPSLRRQAMRVGVTDLPAYIVLDANNAKVVRPP